MSRTDFFEINGKNIYFWILNFKYFSYINQIQSIIVLKIKKIPENSAICQQYERKLNMSRTDNA